MRNVKGTLSLFAIVALAYAGLAAQTAPAAAPAQALPDYQGAVPEQFMLKGKITKIAEIPEGVTAPRKVTLDYNGQTHLAVFKSIDIYRPGFSQFDSGGTGGEGEFQDTWMTEIAAYQIDLMIGFGKVPATVERFVKNEQGSLQWWVDSMMEEGARLKKGLEPPDKESWNRETLNMRLFDNLIYNTDRNEGNILITSDWKLRLIDHSRSFRPFSAIKTPKDLTRFSRSMLDGLKKLDKNEVQKKLGKYLNANQVKALFARRDALLKLAQDTVAQKGEAAVLFP